MGLMDWFSMFKLSWFRRCKGCGMRGSKCLCRRPSLALEHIFFLEERKNKFGARNFSHVSDTMMTTNSTMFTNSTATTNMSTGGGVGLGQASITSSTAMLPGNSSLTESDVNPTDFYFQGTNAMPPAAVADTPTKQDWRHRQHSHRRSANARRHRSRSACAGESPVAAEEPSRALVRKQSGRMVTKRKQTQKAPIQEVTTGEYIIYNEKNAPLSLAARQLQAQQFQQQMQQQQHAHQQLARRARRQSRKLKSQENSKRMASTALARKQEQEQGVSFQFFGRGGSGRGGQPVPVVPAARYTNGSISSSCSTNDSLMLRPGSISSMRASTSSERMSLENNFGSFNPSQGMCGGGSRFIEGGYAPSIQEEEEALQRLNGWLQESPTSTQDSFMMSRDL